MYASSDFFFTRTAVGRVHANRAEVSLLEPGAWVEVELVSGVSPQTLREANAATVRTPPWHEGPRKVANQPRLLRLLRRFPSGVSVAFFVGFLSSASYLHRLFLHL